MLRLAVPFLSDWLKSRNGKWNLWLSVGPPTLRAWAFRSHVEHGIAVIRDMGNMIEASNCAEWRRVGLRSSLTGRACGRRVNMSQLLASWRVELITNTTSIAAIACKGKRVAYVTESTRTRCPASSPRLAHPFSVFHVPSPPPLRSSLYPPPSPLVSPAEHQSEGEDHAYKRSPN